MKALQTLKSLYLTDNRRRYPNLPDGARCYPKWNDRTANGLTKMIIDILRLKGHMAERVNNTGRPIDKRQQVVDVLGRVRTIGTMQWIPGTGTKGTADIHAVIHGRAVKIEVKMPGDRQSEAQKKYQQQIEASGGIYLIATSFEQFFNWYQKL